MRLLSIPVIAAVLAGAAWAQSSVPCACGRDPAGPPAPRSLKPYTGAPEDLRPFSKFTTPYHEYYQDLVEYNGAARDVPDPDLKDLDEIRIGFLAPLYDHPDQVLGNRMLNGATMAIDEANAAGGYGGKPFRLVTHNDYDNWQMSKSATAGATRDSAIWGAASNDAVRMIYDDKVWAMFGSISSESTHIALRLTLKAETPLVNSASTDPTIPETAIPWYFTDLQDDRLQGYTLARHIYTDLGLEASRNPASERSLRPFRRAQIPRRISPPRPSRSHRTKVYAGRHRLPPAAPGHRRFARRRHRAVDRHRPRCDDPATNAGTGMKQRVFGSHRTIGDELITLAGPAAEGFEAVFPYDPHRTDAGWQEFSANYEARFHEKPDHFAALAYDQMRILLDAICRAGLNKGRIRDALTATQSYKGVTGDMVFDPNCKNIAPLFLAHVRNGTIDYRRITMEKPYARVSENGVQYSGPTPPDEQTRLLKIAVFGPHADELIRAPETVRLLNTLNVSGKHLALIAIPSETPWGKASAELVKAVYEEHVVAMIALDRPSSHLAEQIAVKSFVPVVAIASDRALTSTNIPWIFRLPEGTPLQQALLCLSSAIEQAGSNRVSIRDLLASGKPLAGMRFESTGELK